MKPERTTDFMSWGEPQYVTRWPDIGGHPITSAYVETFWLPVLGPTATWMVRKLAALLEPVDGAVVSFTELAQAIGVRPVLGPHTVLTKTVDRLVMFRIMARTGDAQWRVKCGLPNLPKHQYDRLPDSLRYLLEQDKTRVAPTG